jgi:AraC family transcriptional regulator
MNQTNDPRPFRSLAGHLVAPGFSFFHPGYVAGSFGSKAIVPLLPHSRTASAAVSFELLPRLVITVYLDPVQVEQQWLLDVSSGAEMTTLPDTGNVGSTRASAIKRACDCVQYHLPRATLNDFTDAHGLPRISTSLSGRLGDSAIFARLTDLILPCLESPNLLSSTFMDHFVMLFCAHVVHYWSLRPTDEVIHRGGLSTWQRRRAIEVLSKGEYDDVRLAVVAKECRLSVSHFARSFKKTFGQPVHRWIIEQRVDRAKQLLLNSDESLLEIAFQSGFCDQASFNRTFAKLTGTSPGRWRRDFKA